MKDSFELLDRGTFWLSETPEQAGSVGWDASLPRIASWGKFVHKTTAKVFFHFNTHFDHKGEKARQNSAKLILQSIDRIAENETILVTGDFNIEPTSLAYETLSASLDDSFDRAQEHDKSEATCLEFKVGESKGVRIDYIFSRGVEEIASYKTLTENEQGYYPSDHVPVLVELRL